MPTDPTPFGYTLTTHNTPAATYSMPPTHTAPLSQNQQHTRATHPLAQKRLLEISPLSHRCESGVSCISPKHRVSPTHSQHFSHLGHRMEHTPNVAEGRLSAVRGRKLSLGGSPTTRVGRIATPSCPTLSSYRESSLSLGAETIQLNKPRSATAANMKLRSVLT